MKTALFDYKLPKHLIADYPSKTRDQSRLLCVDRKTEKLRDKIFKNIVDELQDNDLLVFNNSRVMAARLYGQKLTGGRLEFLIEKIIDKQKFISHIRAGKAPKTGTEILIEGHLAEVLNQESGLYTLKLSDEISIWQLMENYGHIPLPPYIKREDKDLDKERYQTVYSKPPGSVAAPTAGLHFTETLLDQIKIKGTQTAYITLHVGSGTFKPVQVENINAHVMHREFIDVPDTVCQRIQKTKAQGGRVIAVGTTTVRSLESAALSGTIKPFYGESDIFLYPGKPFRVVDAMITNFHLPKSTLIMLVSAFATTNLIQKAYRHAVDASYRFYSYGDAMFIH